MEENHSLDQVVGSSLAPQLAQIVRDGTLLTQFYATQHPSLPNYIALLAGDTYGITSDCNACTVNAANLVDQLEAAHISWRAYMQGLPADCSAGVHQSGAYAKKHDPFVYFSSIASDPQRCRNVVPYTQFAADAASGQLPQFVWVTPDLDHDMHGAAEGKTDAQLVPAADAFLGQLYRELRASPDWKQDTRLIVTWDEGNGGQTGSHGCCGGDAVGGHIATVVVRSTKPGGTDGRTYDHYDLLRSIETLFGLSHLAKAADRNSIDIPVLARRN
jgi:hypothetical protein